jgi:ATP-binding protein involved in chromosome partitioning
MLGINSRLGGADGKIHPNEVKVPSVRPNGPEGTLKVVSMGFLVEDEGMALMWRGLVLAKAVEQFLTDVRWGDLDYLLVDMPPGTGDIQMALSRLLPRAELLVVTTPALAAQKVAVRVADMARRSYLKVAGVVENMSAFTCDHGQSYPLFGSGGGQALADEVKAPLLAQIPLEPGVAAGGDTGSPLALAEPQSPAGQAFHLLAHRIATEVMPPVEMSGCTARVFAAANANLAALDAAKADEHGPGEGEPVSIRPAQPPSA